MSNDNPDSTKPAEPPLLEDKAANENVTRLDVDGNKVPLLDELGPMVVNSDGVSVRGRCVREYLSMADAAVDALEDSQLDGDDGGGEEEYAACAFEEESVSIFDVGMTS